MRAVYAIALYQLCAQAAVCSRLHHWLRHHALWEGDQYTCIPPDFQPEGYEQPGALISTCSKHCWCPDSPHGRPGARDLIVVWG